MISKTIVTVTLACLASRAVRADSWGPNPTFDCAMRKYAYEHGKSLLPRMGAFESLYYALDLNDPNCTEVLNGTATQTLKTKRLPEGPILFVDPIHGTDDFDRTGLSEEAPLRTLGEAVKRAAEADTTPAVVLRGGTHFLDETIVITPEHEGLHILSYPGESATVSGGVPLPKLDWKEYDVSDGKNVYVADLDKITMTALPTDSSIKGLQHATLGRMTVARYPNLPGGIEVSCGYDCMVSSSDAQWTPPQFDRFGNVTYYTDMNPLHKRNNSADGGNLDNWFSHYMIGINGLCSVYDPPVSYWCSEHTSGGGAFAFRTPSGMTPKSGALPNAPYKNVDDLLAFVWRPARWANWMFEIADYDATSNNFTFGKGGNQGARGENSGGDFFVQGVLEELDAPSEFLLDRSEGKLYVFHNGTGAPPSDGWVVPSKQVLVNMTGTQWNPVRNVKLSDVTYTASGATFMERHGVPSAGDWALDRFGAVFLQGTESVTIEDCRFERVDGNGVMISGYNRNATILDSDFAFIGGNAIASWGYTNETEFDPGRPGVRLENYPAAGVDGTDGEHPRYNLVQGCTAREVGLYEKQSSFYIQAKTAQSTLTGNVFFNGPRAGINANDGFGGGDVISHNLVFSTCRESGDHGPFNSWDRQPFLTTVRTGEPSMQMEWREIHHNFFIDNYSPQENVDNDDGSAWYKTHDNFFVYGGQGMKNDFGGHDNHHYNNVYAYVGQALGVCGMLDGHEDVFENNRVVMTGTNVGGPQCSAPGKTKMANNAYYTPSGDVSECGSSLADWQAKDSSNEPNSTVSKTPSDEAIIGWARDVLGH